MSDRLERIFIRAQNADGKWDSISLKELTDEQFNEWYGKWLARIFKDNRKQMIELLDFLQMPPVELKDDNEAKED